MNNSFYPGPGASVTKNAFFKNINHKKLRLMALCYFAYYFYNFLVIFLLYIYS